MERFASSRPYTPPSGVLEVFVREFDYAYERGGLFLLTMHPHVTGHASRIQIPGGADPAHSQPRRSVVCPS